jgi:hypothetical protein
MKAYFDRDRLRDAKVKKFVDFLVERFANYDWDDLTSARPDRPVQRDELRAHDNADRAGP